MQRGRPFVVVWQDSAAELRARYERERDPQLARRWHVLWLLRCSRSLAEVAAIVGIAYRTVQEWIRWYRAGGIEALRGHRRGGNRRVIAPLLSPDQERAVQQQARAEGFVTYAALGDWLQTTQGVRLTPRQVPRLAQQLGLRRKVPRPLAAKADLAQQAAWKKGA